MTAKVRTMEEKRPQQIASVTESTQKGFKLWEFAGEVKDEFQRITWTSKEELSAYTKIVVGATFLLGMAIYFADLIIQGTLSTFEIIARLIGG